MWTYFFLGELRSIDDLILNLNPNYHLRGGMVNKILDQETAGMNEF